MSEIQSGAIRTPGIDVMDYDRSTVTPGIVHLGIGAFHRAHMAAYVDSLLARTPDWGIIGASLRRPDTREALEPQDFLYTLAVRDASGTKPRIIGSILDVLDANTQRAELIETMASPAIRIVSLTVTEKGYCHDPSTGELDQKHPDIVHDLAHPEAPISAPGIIVAALELRRQRGLAPFTVMSCDNLPSNGRTAGRIVRRLAELMDGGAGLAGYVQTVSFPSTMIDRIVPATTDADRAIVADITGLEDAWPIMTEPFTQWVIEDDFPAGRPPFETVGAELVEDVEPFELMKLRMLNGSHSSMAYLGYLSGYQYVNEAIADPGIHQLIHGLMTEEAMPTLPMSRATLEAYRDQLLARFANPALKHRTWQIAMDGTQKLPQRLLGTIRDRLEAAQPFPRLALGVAAWMRYVTGIDEAGQPIDVKDPMAARLREIADGAGQDPVKLANGLLAVTEVFGTDLPQVAVFRDTVTNHLKSLLENGAREAVRRVS
ncbi:MULTISPECIES: mannitol dehydrogenase family protein [unclassified Devosia]|uniref:mannitol dehydrogenase family protein n=1 Tax=unclassified Devosia TaxID=196773 RepID=UPI00086A8C62|nr:MULTISPECIES: mannitol dehydrogenase family protein [unclassified Devosia]MBN9360982.1 mannitol dehydrogenase family protein [Devosia sp.]ODS85369.1 MAG: mannitol dehydrogenase [Devosia sp. SCN 66-27]OJX23142.1 MAG: mannitol dehydrogenase [Devosia sp. 66-14]